MRPGQEETAMSNDDQHARVSAAAGRLARAGETTLRERAAFMETMPEPAGELSPREHAEMDEAIARTAYYAARDGLEAGS
jgi:hypothetical protein